MLAAAAGAQEPGEPSPFADATDRTARIGRVAGEEAPEVDGDLGDPCWAEAPEIGPLVQVEPWEGTVPPHRTRVRLLHDQDAFYMAIECFDEEPGEIRATQRERDADLDPDDRVEWVLDTFQNRRLGYWFQIGAGGSRGDALISGNGSSFNKDWDAIWDGAVRTTAVGWQAEVAIPFRSLGRSAGAVSWGFNLRRIRRTGNHEFRWNTPVLGRRFFRVSEAGTMTGLGAIDPGMGLEFVPYTSFGARRSRSVDRDFDLDQDAGGEVFYRVTPELTFVATFFTDFAETENDQRRINLDRFPLFFPEKRDFFLEDAGRFEFGRNSRALLPFFSRRIGLVAGEEVPILAGMKVAGEVDGTSIGFLDVQTDDTAALEGRNLGVVRLNQSVAEETTVGMIATHGRPAADGENTVVGADFFHREPTFVGDLDLRLWGTVLASQTWGVGGDGNAWSLQADADGSEWGFGLRSRWITGDFNPELGFVRRRGVKDHRANLSWQPRVQGAVIRNWSFRGSAQGIWDEGNELEELEFELDELGVESHEGDELSLELGREFQRVDRDFTVFDGVATIRAGDYWETRVGAELGTSEGRPVSGELRGSVGDFFDGESTEWSVGLAWRTGPLLLLGAEYEQTDAELPGVDFRTLITEGRADLHFSTRLSLRNLVQYDNESRNLGFQSRLRWILEPGSDLFVAASGGWVKGDDGNFRPEDQALVVKVSHSVRF